MSRTPSEQELRGAVAPPDPWDPLIRISHWTVALIVVLNGLILKPGGTLHIWLGWAVMTLLVLRLLWGFIGPAEARFSAFPPSPAGAMRHLSGLLRGRVRDYPSHNPAGAMMVYALWASLVVVVATGLIMTDGKTPLTIAEDRAAVAAGDWSVLVSESSDDGQAGEGQAGEGQAGDEDSEGGEIAEDIHEAAVNLVLILALLHVLGVAVESRALGRNLLRPMITRSGGRR